MAGRLRTNFRFGNLAEHLGILLLKGAAAVAEVPRQEDVGLDAIATLLRRDDDGNCYAEDSFLVQLKSESVSNIEYRDHELTWLVAQTQPMFVGRVSLAKSEISLYPTLHVNQAVLALNSARITVNFGVSDLQPFLFEQKWGRWHGDRGSGDQVWLGPPLLRWTLGDLTDPEWVKRTYEILKRFLALARRELELLSFGQSSILQWEPNDLASISSYSFSMKGGHEDLPSLLERLTPCLRAILMRAIMMPGDAGNSLSISLLAFCAALRDHGIDLDRDNLFAKLFVHLKQNPIQIPYQPPQGSENKSDQI